VTFRPNEDIHILDPFKDNSQEDIVSIPKISYSSGSLTHEISQKGKKEINQTWA
jgi:hypothetical protein